MKNVLGKEKFFEIDSKSKTNVDNKMRKLS